MKSILSLLLLTLFHLYGFSNCVDVTNNTEQELEDALLPNFAGLTVPELYDLFVNSLTVEESEIFNTLVPAIIANEGDIDAFIDESTLLIRAASAGNISAVSALVNNEVNINLVDLEGHTALFHSLTLRKFEVADFLIGNGADLTIEPNILIKAIQVASPMGIVEKLIDGGVDVNFVDTQNLDATALSFACAHGNRELFHLLLQRGANIHVGMSPLCGAARKGQVEIAKELLEMGADVNYTMANGDTPLHIAAYENVTDNTEIVLNLLKYGADVNAQNLLQKTPLLIASQFGAHPGVIDTLIEYGANVNVPDEAGRTPLMRAIASTINTAENIHRLIISSPSLHEIDNFGMSAIHHAASNDNVEVIAFLLGHGIDIDTLTTNDQQTPLMIAVKKNNSNAANFLLANGANPNIQILPAETN